MVLALSIVAVILIILVIMQAFKIHAAQEQAAIMTKKFTAADDARAMAEGKRFSERCTIGELTAERNKLREKVAEYESAAAKKRARKHPKSRRR